MALESCTGHAEPVAGISGLIHGSQLKLHNAMPLILHLHAFNTHIKSLLDAAKETKTSFCASRGKQLDVVRWELWNIGV